MWCITSLQLSCRVFNKWRFISCVDSGYGVEWIEWWKCWNILGMRIEIDNGWVLIYLFLNISFQKRSHVKFDVYGISITYTILLESFFIITLVSFYNNQCFGLMLDVLIFTLVLALFFSYFVLIFLCSFDKL